MKTIVSLLSDQLIPNLLFIKQKGKEEDKHIFLSTIEMEQRKKSEILADALQITETQFNIILISPHSPSDTIKQLSTQRWNREKQYIVNITGGNKLMSLIAFSFFSRFSQAEIFYWPIDTNQLEQLHPALTKKTLDSSIELDLATYLRAHGYTFSAASSLSQPYQKSDKLYLNVVQNGNAGTIPEIIKAKKKHHYGRNKKYYTGGWFEEWMYETIKQTLHLDCEHVAHNVKLKSKFSEQNTESDNEVDVAFTYKNRLHLIECKVYSGKLTGKKIYDPIYKISTFKNVLGLNATLLVAILAPFGDIGSRNATISYLTRMAQVKKVFSLEDMKHKEQFIQKIKKIVDYE